jgi:hypothetical protein
MPKQLLPWGNTIVLQKGKAFGRGHMIKLEN